MDELEKREERWCHGASGKPFSVATDKGEKPGRYFHPLLATLITGAARLMLAVTETLAAKAGLDWAFCDTDSMALAKPDNMEEAAFFVAAQTVRDWFKPLNPYERKATLLKVEDANYALCDGGRTDGLAPLYCWAVSAKRYALFNIDGDGRPIIRKASAHGLGHLIAPYDESDAPSDMPEPSAGLDNIGVERWQHDLWHRIIGAAINGHPAQVPLDWNPALAGMAASRYAATTPMLLRWFKSYNQDRSYRDQVRPFNFMLAFQAARAVAAHWQDFALTSPTNGGSARRTQPKPVAPFNKDILQAAARAFDRETGDPVKSELLKSYRQNLAQYHLHPESKFANGDYLNRGPTRRRHVEAVAVHHIGEEANRWEEQFHVGLDLDAQIEYGVEPGGAVQFLATLREAADAFGHRTLAEKIGVTRTTLARLLAGENVRLSRAKADRVCALIKELTAERTQEETWRDALIELASEEISRIGVKEFAGRLGVDRSNLHKFISCTKKMGSDFVSKIDKYFAVTTSDKFLI